MNMPVIVHIEDNEISANLVMKQLRLNNVLVISAEDARSGIDAVMRHRPDLVLLDYNLPDKTGLEVLSWLRAFPGMERTRVIMLTADDSDTTRQNALDNHVDLFLTKPVSRETLLSSIRGLIN